MSLSVAALIRGIQQMKPESHIRGRHSESDIGIYVPAAAPVIEDLWSDPGARLCAEGDGLCD